MARTFRHSVKGRVYHVMMRGNNAQDIFSSEMDRRKFYKLLEEGVEAYGHRIIAFCLMTNHVHMAVQVGEVPLSKIFQSLNQRYTKYFHLAHKTSGHLFQGRFKSILVHGTRYQSQLIRYIHLNPVRAGIVNDPCLYCWSSHHGYLMLEDIPWLDRDVGLGFFGSTKEEALEKYQRFINAESGGMLEVDFKKGIRKGIVGDDLYIDAFSESENKSYELDKDRNIGALLSLVMEKYDLSGEKGRLLGRDRRSSEARAICSYLTTYTSGVTLKGVAAHLNRTEATLARAGTRVQRKTQQKERLKKEMLELKEKVKAFL